MLTIISSFSVPAAIKHLYRDFAASLHLAAQEDYSLHPLKNLLLYQWLEGYAWIQEYGIKAETAISERLFDPPNKIPLEMISKLNASEWIIH